MADTYDRPQLEILLPNQKAVPTRQTDMRSQTRGENAASPTYYGQPMIKSPTWKWPIPVYFWLGGVAGGAAVVGAVADIFGGEEYRSTVRHARWLALGLGAICPIPLIQDLGRPERFLHMLRVFKVASPLNMGTWILTGFGGVSSLLAARQAAEDSFIVSRESWLGRALRSIPGKPLSILHGMLGIALGGYTGVVLTSSAVPIWASRGVLLGSLFESTAIASGAAAVNLIGIIDGKQTAKEREHVDTIEAVSQIAQLGIALAFDVGKPAQIRQPLRAGRTGSSYRMGAVGAGIMAPLALKLGGRLLGKRRRTWLYAARASLSLAGALIERLAIVEAGKVSASDPLAYQELTKGLTGKDRPALRQQAAQAPTTSGYSEGIVVSDHHE